MMMMMMMMASAAFVFCSEHHHKCKVNDGWRVFRAYETPGLMH
jgi:hypothetical protein